jgi:hypothetical protein
VRRWHVLAIAAVAAIVAVVVWLAVRDGHSSSTQSTGAVAVSPRELERIARAAHQPIYWLGAQASTTYELRRLNRRIYVRYLPAGVSVGDPKGFVTVGTYAVQNAFTVVDTGSRKQGAVRLQFSGGGVGLYRPAHPTNVYAAFPGSNYEIEVYAPTPRAARRLVERGRLKVLGPSDSSRPASGPVAVSAAELKAVAANLGRPIYWAGSQPDTTYELTRTPEGRIYVRYLPPGVGVGARKPYLTIGTYPLANAFLVTKKAGRLPGAVRIPVGGGGVAVYNVKQPKNVYLAYPGVNFQIEVYDPKPGGARKLVTAESIAPVR